MTDRDALKLELDLLTATRDQRNILEANPQRGLAAIREARHRGATNVAGYAVSVYNSTFSPKTELVRGTNRHASVDCPTCDGDRMVLYSIRTDTYNGRSAEIEEYAPCPDCNPDCNTTRDRFRSPDPAQVRERLSR